MGPMAWIPTGSVSVSLCRAVDAASLGAAFQSSHFDRAPRSRTGQDGQRREDAYKLESRTSNGSSHDDDDITCDDCRLLSVSHTQICTRTSKASFVTLRAGVRFKGRLSLVV